MHPGLPSQNVVERTRALVLGNPCVALRIASDLRNQGFETEIAKDLPSPADPKAIEKLRSLLEPFARLQSGDFPYAPCVHPGTSDWAERPELSQVGQEFGLSVICPPSRVLSLFSNKLNLLGEADRLGIPHLVLGFDPIQSVREIESFLGSRQVRFPFILKSVRGGAPTGVLAVHSADDLGRRLGLWVEQLRRNLGEALFFVERHIEGARRITVPFSRLHGGRIEIFPWVDSSLQSRSRKLIEFCPAEGLDPEASRSIEAWTHQLAEASGFVGVGSFDFFADGPRAYLLEGLARLNTAFHLWERVARTSAVAWQLLALGAGRSTDPPETRVPRWTAGVALRVLAEDPVLQLPQAGDVSEVSERREWLFPRSSAVLDLPLHSGSEVSADGEVLLGVLYAGAGADAASSLPTSLQLAADRKQAITLAQGALSEMWISGALQTNERLLSELISHPWVQGGLFHAGFIDEEFVPELRPSEETLRIAAALCSFASNHAVHEDSRWAVGDQWVKSLGSNLDWQGSPEIFEVPAAVAPGSGRALFGARGCLRVEGGRRLRVCAYPVLEDRWQVRLDRWFVSVRRVEGSRRAPVSGGVSGASQSQARSHSLLALVSGRVHSVLFREGAWVPAHEPVLVIESLRSLVPHALPIDIRVNRWLVSAEEKVQAGQKLAVLDSSKV